MRKKKTFPPGCLLIKIRYPENSVYSFYYYFHVSIEQFGLKNGHKRIIKYINISLQNFLKEKLFLTFLFIEELITDNINPKLGFTNIQVSILVHPIISLY